MTPRLALYVPERKDMWFRREMLLNPETMSYNANWDVDFPGYDRDTGCIEYTPEQEEKWYSRYIGNEPARYFAYVRRTADGRFVGDVCFHHNPKEDRWDMEVLIHAPYRGVGYGTEALRLMLRHAFVDCGVNRIHNDFEADRGGGRALQTHLSAGFRLEKTENGFARVTITREEYLALGGGHERND